MQLVERHGVVTREAVLAEGVVGGFASVYGVLKVLEDRGQVRRGYFVSGLGAAQFALPGAVDRLRSIRRPDDPAFPAVPDDAGERAPATVVLSATDPAQPYGGTLPWPESPVVRRASVPPSSSCATAFHWCGTTGAPITS